MIKILCDICGKDITKYFNLGGCKRYYSNSLEYNLVFGREIEDDKHLCLKECMDKYFKSI